MQMNVFKHLTKIISFQIPSLITIYLPHLFTATEFHYITILSSTSHFPLHPHITSPHHTKEEREQPSPTPQAWVQYHCWWRRCCPNHIIFVQWTQSWCWWCRCHKCSIFNKKTVQYQYWCNRCCRHRWRHYSNLSQRRSPCERAWAWP